MSAVDKYIHVKETERNNTPSNTKTKHWSLAEDPRTQGIAQIAANDRQPGNKHENWRHVLELFFTTTWCPRGWSGGGIISGTKVKRASKQHFPVHDTAAVAAKTPIYLVKYLWWSCCGFSPVGKTGWQFITRFLKLHSFLYTSTLRQGRVQLSGSNSTGGGGYSRVGLTVSVGEITAGVGKGTVWRV